MDATLARVGREESERSARFSLGNVPGSNGRQIRLPDFFAVAAALFLAVSIGWPLYQVINRQNTVLHSQTRLNEYGAGIISFAAENNDALPMDGATIEASGHTMDDLPDAIIGNYGTQLHKSLTDPRLHLSPSFERDEKIRIAKIGPVSYRVPVSVRTFKLGAYDPSEPLLADPNPVIRSRRLKQPSVSPRLGSHLHGQNMVVVVRFDLSIDNLPSPVLPDGDCLWVHDGYDHAAPSADESIRPLSLEDAVLAH